MNKKLLIILGVLAALALVFMALNLLRGGATDVRSQLDAVFNTDQQITDLSLEASNRGGVYALKVVASNIAATSSSDLQQLKTAYEQAYGKELKEAKLAKEQDPVQILKATEDGIDFDSKYKELATQALEQNIATMRAVLSQATQKDQASFGAPLETAINNQTSSLEQLKNTQ